MFNLKLTIYGAIFGLIISIFFGLVGGGIQFGGCGEAKGQLLGGAQMPGGGSSACYSAVFPQQAVEYQFHVPELGRCRQSTLLL